MGKWYRISEVGIILEDLKLVLIIPVEYGSFPCPFWALGCIYRHLEAITKAKYLGTNRALVVICNIFQVEKLMAAQNVSSTVIVSKMFSFYPEECTQTMYVYIKQPTKKWGESTQSLRCFYS